MRSASRATNWARTSAPSRPSGVSSCSASVQVWMTGPYWSYTSRKRATQARSSAAPSGPGPISPKRVGQLAEAVGHVGGEGPEEVLLAGEVPVEGAVGGVGRLDDVVDPGGVQPPPSEHGHAGGQEAVHRLHAARPQLAPLRRPPRPPHHLHQRDRTRSGRLAVAERVRSSAVSSTGVPAPGEAPVVAASAAALLRSNGTDPEIAARPAAADPGADLDPRRGVRRGLPLRHPVPGAPAGRPATPRRRAGRQHPRVPLHLRRRGPDRGDRRRPEPHPPGRAPVAGPAPRRRRPRHHRAGPPGRPRPDPGRPRPARRERAPRRPRARGGPARRRRRPRPRARPRHPLGAHLHLGDVVGAQGGHLHPAPAPGDRQPHADADGHRPRRRRLHLHAPVPLQRGDGGLGPLDRGRGVGRPGPALQRQPVAARHPPLRRHLVQLHGQAPQLPGGLAGAARRRRQPAAGGVRQRGGPRRGRTLLPALRRPGDRRLRRHRGRHRRQPGGGHAGRRARSGQARRCKSSTRTGSRSRWPASTPTVACSTRRTAWARSSTPPAAGPSRATTTTTRRTRRPPATAGTGAATSATSTTTGSSTSPGGRRTGSGSTARTSRPGRSRTPWSDTPTSSWPPSTGCPTWRPATR